MFRRSKIPGKKISENRPAIIIGRFVLTLHSYKETPELDHKDLFLYYNDNDYLITYKVPKNTTSGFGIRQKDHRLKYLSWEGNLRENEVLQVSTRGYFVTHNWLFSSPENNYAKITFESFSGSIDNMWKKTDFKIALDEIKLYEVSDEEHFQTDKKISERTEEEKPTVITSVKTEVVTEEIAEATKEETGKTVIEQEPVVESLPKPEPIIKSPVESQSEYPKEPASLPPEKEPEPQEDKLAKPSQAAPVSQAGNLKVVHQEETEISFAPIKEMVLNPDGKSEEEYDPSL
jgi:hypothetical protein